MEDRNQINSAALQWLYEMEALDSPVLLKNLYENVFFAHPGILDCKIFITPAFTHQKGIMVWLKLKFFTKIFDKNSVHENVKAVLHKLLPSFKIRIVNDEAILEMATNKVKEMYERPNSNNHNDIGDSDKSDGSKDGKD